MSKRFADSDIERDYARVFALDKFVATDGDALEDSLTSLYRSIFSMDLAQYDTAELVAAAPHLIDELFRLRMRLRDQIADWRSAGWMTLGAQRALRDVMRAARYAADMIGEMAHDNVRLASGDRPFKAFTGSHLSVSIHPDYEARRPIPFEAGDVLLVRGRLHNSAAIARIGDVDSQYCHVGIVHVDADGRQVLVESLIEIGATITPLSQALADNIGRAALFRHKDRELAARAAAAIHDKVARSLERRGRRIPYDFTMLLDDPRAMFCSKLVYHAFLAGSGGKVHLPAFPTRLDMSNRDFFQRIGVRAKQTFSPGDMEIDPDFDMIAEWQDFRVTADLRLQDMIMDQIFEWMDVHGYVFEEDFTIRLIGVMGRASAFLSERAKTLISSVVPRVPKSMSRVTIQTVAMLHKTGEELLAEMRRIDMATTATRGHPLHPRDARAYLEAYRARVGRRIGYLVAPV